jgi:hypothetical protein
MHVKDIISEKSYLQNPKWIPSSIKSEESSARIDVVETCG